MIPTVSDPQEGFREPDAPAAHSLPLVVLDRPGSPGNIGAAARAMKNMGLTRLRLVAPRLFPH
ncbi:MAG: hypothetical protein H7831_15640, partial [Magnetococcus sp. WYHC-3]